jgi:hypothetical protein
MSPRDGISRTIARSLSAVAALIALGCGPVTVFAVNGFDIHLNPGPNLSQNPEALAAFERAAQAWENYISTPIRININAEVAPDPRFNIIGSTDIFNGGANFPFINQPYTLVRDAMAARSVRPGDSVLASLPTSAQLHADVPTGGTFDNTTVGITTANQKALGLLDGSASNTFVDAAMTFNSNFSFDYDSSDGVSPGKMDFQTAATHEIGHVLGFLSDTDDYDAIPELSDPNLGLSDNATTLDLFRFNRDNLPTALAEFTAFHRELRPTQHATFADLTNAFAMSTGVLNGDGNQASHWQDDIFVDQLDDTLIIQPNIGIMDPTLNFGTLESITAADLRAMELIGYDTIPEPSAFALMTIATIPLITRRRRAVSTSSEG